MKNKLCINYNNRLLKWRFLPAVEMTNDATHIHTYNY